jgi:two-component system OmpR family response regulator
LFDLRQLGWEIVDTTASGEAAMRSPALASQELLDEPGWSDLGQWRFAPLRNLVLVTGVDDLDARASLLRRGFGDVTGSDVSLREIEARAMRIAALADLMPRSRQCGPLRLDLFARDAFVAGQRLGLQPREFALIWRLSEMPGRPLSKRVLLRDVWRMAHVPETNSLAVHVYRLRAKLAYAGLEWMVQTTRDGGYLFATRPDQGTVSSFLFADGGYEEHAPLTLSVFQGLNREYPE